MKYRKLDSSGDYTLGLGDSGYYTGADAVTQAIQTKLKMFEGEWWENLSDGLPLFQSILGDRGTASSLSTADLLVQTRIAETPGVNGITAYSSAYSKGKYTASATVSTIYGAVTVGVG